MVCDAAPPSDQESNTKLAPLIVCTAGASSSLAAPTTPAKARGVACGCPSTFTCTPGTLAWTLIVAVLGRTSRYVVVISPVESWTVRVMRYQTSVAPCPVVGIVKDPPEAPDVAGRNGWTWS